MQDTSYLTKYSYYYIFEFLSMCFLDGNVRTCTNISDIFEHFQQFVNGVETRV